MVIQKGNSLVRVPGDHCELHGGGQERGSRGVQVIDCSTHDGELWLVGAIHQPHYESCYSSQEQYGHKETADGSPRISNRIARIPLPATTSTIRHPVDLSLSLSLSLV